MEKKYIKPQIKVRQLDFDSDLLSASLNGAKPFGGFDFSDAPAPTYGGESSNGEAGDAASKPNIWNNWGVDDYEE